MSDWSPAQAIEQLLAAIVDGRVDDVIDAYSQRDDLRIFVEGPRWETVGQEALARGWRAFLAGPRKIAGVTWRSGPHVHAGSDLTSVSGTVILDNPAGGSELPVRMTWVLALEGDGRWRVVHEHASQPMTDPYGTGDWLPKSSDATQGAS